VRGIVIACQRKDDRQVEWETPVDFTRLEKQNAVRNHMRCTEILPRCGPISRIVSFIWGKKEGEFVRRFLF